MCHTLDHYEALCGRTTEGERGREEGKEKEKREGNEKRETGECKEERMFEVWEG